jgi:hypothetical protein
MSHVKTASVVPAFRLKNFNSFLVFPMLPTCPAHLILLYLIKNTLYEASRRFILLSQVSSLPSVSFEDSLSDSYPGRVCWPRPSTPLLRYVMNLLDFYTAFRFI